MKNITKLLSAAVIAIALLSQGLKANPWDYTFDNLSNQPVRFRMSYVAGTHSADTWKNYDNIDLKANQKGFQWKTWGKLVNRVEVLSYPQGDVIETRDMPASCRGGTVIYNPDSHYYTTNYDKKVKIIFGSDPNGYDDCENQE